MLERFKLLYEKFENTNDDLVADVVVDEDVADVVVDEDVDDVVVDEDDVVVDEDVADVVVDEDKFSLLKSPYKIYLLIFLISIIILFLIIILAFTPSSYNNVNTRPYYNQNKIY